MNEQGEKLQEHVESNPALSELKERIEVQEATKKDSEQLKKSVIDTLLEKLGKTWDSFKDKLKSVPFLAGLFKLNQDSESSTDSSSEEYTPFPSSFEYDSGNKTTAQKLADTIIFGESGFNYGAVNKNDVGSVSIGLMQWHKQRAVDVLKELRKSNQSKFDSIMKDPLFKNLDRAGMAARNEAQAKQFKELMKGKEFQDTMRGIVETDCGKYIDAIKKRGVTDERCLLVLGRIYNAGPVLAKKVFDKVGVSNDYNRYISAFKTTSYVAKWGNLFDKKVGSGNTTLAQQIGNYQSPTGTYTA